MEFRHKLSAVVSLGVLGLVLTGCASGTGGGAAVLSSTNISAEDLATVQGQYASVYDFLRAHSRARFSTRGGREHLVIETRAAIGGEEPAQVVINGREISTPIPRLKGMRLAEVQRMEFLNQSEARMRYGGGGYQGALVIQTGSSGE